MVTMETIWATALFVILGNAHGLIDASGFSLDLQLSQCQTGIQG